MPKDINGNEILPLSGFLNADGTPIEQVNEQPTTGGQEPGGFSSGNEKLSNYDNTPIQINTGVSQIQPQIQGTELKATEASKPIELQLPEQKQRVYTDSGYIDMNSVDYQNYLADKAKRKSEAGTSAKEGNLTPEQIQAEKTTVTTPQGTTTTVKETPKPTVDKTARNNEIVANLNEGYKNDPTVQQAINSGNFELFKSKYNMQNPEEARIVEAFFQAHQPKDYQGFYNILKLGQQIQDKTTLLSPDYIKAKAKYDLFTKYNGMDSNSLLSELKNNNINGELDRELSQNPNYIKAKDDFSKFKQINDINKQGQSTINTITGKTTEPTKITDKLTDQYSGGKTTEELTSFRDYMAKNDPTLVKQVGELNIKEAELKKLTDARDARLKQVQKQYPGLDIGSAVLLANRQNETINEQIKSMSYDLDRLEADIKFRRELLEKDYDNEKDRQALQEQRTYDQKVADDKLKKEFDYTYGDLTSTDPNVKRVAGERIAEAIQKQYAGMPFRRDISTMGADIVREINSGKTIDQITTEITNAIQNSPDYANWKANNKVLGEQTGKYSMGFNPITGEPYTLNQLTGEISGVSGTGTTTTTTGLKFDTSKTGMRTDRHNNPTAMTTDVAKTGGLVEGVDYVKGDPFTSGGKTYYTAKLLGDPIQTTIKAIDNMGFKTKGGQNRWTYTDKLGLNNQTWSQMNQQQKAEAVAKMYQQEGGNGSLVGGTAVTTSYNPNNAALYADVLAGKVSIKEATGLGTTLDKLKQEANAFMSDKGKVGEEGAIDAGSGTPIAYARRIKNMIPSTLQNSELEAKNINDTIRALYATGTSPEDAALAYMGVDLKPEVKQIGIKMIDVLKGTDATPGSFTAIADALNKGNTSGAVQLLENTLYKQRDIPVKDVTEIGNNIKNGQNLINRINTLKSKFGPIAGNETKWKQYIENDGETQRLLSDMTNFVAKYRNGIAGTSVTSNEEDFLNNIIPTITNKPDNAIAKIQSNIGQAFNGLNTIRDTIGLPTLQDMRSSYDINLRKQAFTGRGSGSTTPTNSKPKSDPLGLF